MLKGLYENKAFYQRAFEMKDFQSLFSYGYRKMLVVHIENLERKLGRPLTDGELIELDYTIRALSAMTAKWAEEGMELSPEQLVAIFSRFVPNCAR